MNSMFKAERESAVIEMHSALRGCDSFHNKAILLFSGGRDSTIVASAFCEAFPNGELHLLFIDNGVLLNKNNPFSQYKKLCSLYPKQKIVYKSQKADNLMNKIAIQEIENDFLRERFQSLLVCVSCKLIMYYKAILYGKNVGINVIMDGDSIRQDGYPEQMLSFLEGRKQLFDYFGFTCFSPLYYYLENKNQVKKILKSFSFDDKNEARCMFSDSFSKATEDDLKRYMKKSISLLIQQERKKNEEE